VEREFGIASKLEECPRASRVGTLRDSFGTFRPRVQSMQLRKSWKKKRSYDCERRCRIKLSNQRFGHPREYQRIASYQQSWRNDPLLVELYSIRMTLHYATCWIVSI